MNVGCQPDPAEPFQFTSAGDLAPCLCTLLDRRCRDGNSLGTLIHSKPQTLEAPALCSFVTSTLLRRNPSLASQKTPCSPLASSSPGVTRSCTSRRCNRQGCLEVKYKTLANAGFDSGCITRKAARWKLILASALFPSSDTGLCSVWVWLNQSLLTSLNSFPSLLTKGCLICSVCQSDAGQEFKNKVWEALWVVLFGNAHCCLVQKLIPTQLSFY